MHLTTAVALCGVVALSSAAATTSVVHPDLSGQWTLNAAQSDNPRDMLQARDSSGDEARGAGRAVVMVDAEASAAGGAAVSGVGEG